MSRLEALLKIVSTQYPDDWWITAFKVMLDNGDGILLDQLKIYSRPLDLLDEESWKVIRDKATTSFRQNIRRRGKQSFFNLLNETLAYEYLVESNYENVSLLKEHGKVKVPDVKFSKDGSDYYCEVKTIGVSEEELDRAGKEDCYDSSVYSELGERFFDKLSSVVNTAIEQINTESPENVIYIILNFDDFVGFYHETYKTQLENFLQEKFPYNQIYLRAGLFKRFVHHHLPNPA